MKKILFCAAALLSVLSFVACKGNAPEEKQVDALWGMWLQVPESAAQPADSISLPLYAVVSAAVKNEIMFNEDSTGFCFRQDTVCMLSQWTRNDSVIFVEWFTAGDSVSRALGKTDMTIVKLNSDTLSVGDAVGNINTFVRERDME